MNNPAFTAVALIPARGGSKSIPRKNIMPVGGKPLLVWSIEAAKGCPFISRIIVSSDDDEILSVAKQYGAEAHKRPAELSDDTARSEPVVTHALLHLREEGAPPTFMVYLQPTSPLRTSAHLTLAFEELLQSGADGLISLVPYDKRALKTFFRDENGLLRGAAGNDFPFMNRQALPDVYLSNGAVYIVRSETFLQEPTFFPPKTTSIVMTKEESVDIDSLEDVKRVEEILAIRNIRNR